MIQEQITIDKKTISKSLFWKVFEKTSVQGISLFVQIILARILLQEVFGNLAIIVAITNYAAIFVQSGVSTIIIQKKHLTDADASTILISSLLFAAILYVALFFLAPVISNLYKSPDLVMPLRVQSVILFLNAINAVQTGIYSRKMSFKKMFIRSIIAVPVSGVVGYILAINGFGLWSLVIHNILNAFLIVAIMCFDKSIWFKISFSWSSFKEMYSFTGKIMLTGAITAGGDLVRTMLIGHKYSSDELAYYNQAYGYSNYATQIVGQSVSSVMLSSFSRVQDETERLKNMARRSISLSCFVMFPVLLGIASVSEPLVRVLLTDRWMPLIPFLMLFCVLRMPGFVSNIDKQVYYALGKSGLNLVYEIIFLVANLGTLFIFLNQGVLYIAIGITVLEWLGFVALCFVSKKVFNYSLIERIKDIWRPLLNSIIMFFIVYFFGKYVNINIYLKLVLQVLIGASIFSLLSFLEKDPAVLLLKELIFKRKGLAEE